ncbi:alpha-amylase family glycosyl hydrolase [Streptomyces sp. NPDC046939]|uniref:alpha-amylase family glycosyl hydrolase n=1 Tax=Streptomyces sp. NPDC046939 TaxID=3155376 RepID=UPI0033EB2BAB
MGSLPYEDGAAFRLWAPHAASVVVTGSFNGWQLAGAAMDHEGGGYWYANVPGVKRGDEYKYVITTVDGARLWRTDPYAQAMTGSHGNSLVVSSDHAWGTAPYRSPDWDELVVYELHIGTFNDLPGGGPGTFTDAIERLPYLAKLGINAIELMPAAEFPGSSWGYNPSAPFAVETDFGGPRALKTLVNAAHDLGIAVLFDVVYNHLGPTDLDLWRFDGWYENDGGGIYFYNDGRAWTPWGDTRPDYGRPEVRQYLRDNALHWLEEYRLDGLRWDATSYIRSTGRGVELADGWGLMRWINDEIDRRQPWKLSIAEDMANDARITDATPGGAGFDAQWDDGFVRPVRAALTVPDDRSRDMRSVCDAIEHRYDNDAFHRIQYLESHDASGDLSGNVRLPEAIWPHNADSWYAKKRATLGSVLVLTSPGIPMLFQGQEFLADGTFDDRNPLDWTREDRYTGIVRLHRDLIALRRNRTDRTAGLRGQDTVVHHVNNTDKVIAFHRYAHAGPRDSTVILANFGNRAYCDYLLGLPRHGTWRIRFNSDWSGYDPTFSNHPAFDLSADGPSRDGMPCSGAVGLGPYSAIIMSQDE